jgi:hypothetical protein
MKKEDLYSLVVYGVMVAIALFVGLEIIAPAFRTLGIVGVSQYGYAIITIVAAFLINVILLELGHVLGAIVGGYDIKSVNILGLALYRAEKGWRIGFKSFEGLSGETVVAPKNSKSKPVLNLWGGLILYMVEVVVGFYLAYYVFLAEEWGRYASIIVIAIGGMLMIYNFMPFRMDTVTDGYRLATLSNEKGNEAYNELIRIEKAYKDHQDPKPFKTFKEVNNLTAQILLYKIYDALIYEKYDEALGFLERIEAHPRLGEVYQQRAFSIRSYITLWTGKKKEASDYFYNLPAKDRKFLANHNAMLTMTAYLIVAGTIEDSYSEARFCVDRRPGSLAKIKEPGRAEIENNLFENVLAKVQKKHPDWDLNP